MPSPEIYFKIKERIMKQLADKLAAIDAEEFLVESKESEESTAAEDAAHPATTVETAANGTAVVGGASSQDSAAGQKTGPSELTTAGASQPDEQQAEVPIDKIPSSGLTTVLLLFCAPCLGFHLNRRFLSFRPSHIYLFPFL
jgi:hypothetical protein